MTIYSLYDLETWKTARKFRQSISLMVRENVPKHEKYLLKDQIIRSSRSVPANIAEGFGRYHYKENIQYCRQARGSLFETLDHLTCSLDESYINQTTFSALEKDANHCLKILNGYIAYLNKAAKG